MSPFVRYQSTILRIVLGCCTLVQSTGCVLPGHWGKKHDSLAAAKAFAQSRSSIAKLDTSDPLASIAQTAFSERIAQADRSDLNSLERLPEPAPPGNDNSHPALQFDSEMLEVEPNPSGNLPGIMHQPSIVGPTNVTSESIVVYEPSTSTRGSFAPRDASQLLADFRYLSDTEMISIALSQSPVIRPLGIRVIDQPAAATTVFDRAISVADPFYGPQAALAQFDSQLAASLDSQNNDRVFNNRTLGGNVQELTQDFANVNLGWQKRMLGGGIVGISSVTSYDGNNRQSNLFPNYWERQLEASIRQPLARGAGRNYNMIAGPNAQPGFNFSNGIVIARLNTQISDADFDIAVRRFVRDLYTVYWDLASKYETYERVNEAADLAYKTWQATLAKRQASIAGGEANREAESRAKFYRYRRELQLALGGPNGLYVTERQLRQQMGLPIVDGQVLRPSVAAASAPVHFDFETLVAEGLANRTEIQRQTIRVQQQELRLVAAKNFLLPQVDAIGRYRTRGFGDDLYGSGSQFASANQDLFSLDHQEWQFGVEMGVTVGRRQAHAAVQSASLLLQRERAILQQQQREIEHEVSDAYAGVLSAYAALETSTSQVAAARERLAASAALFESDQLQIEFLLDAQAELLQAEQFRIADQTQYAIALIQVVNATGRLLFEAGVDVSSTCSATHDAVNIH